MVSVEEEDLAGMEDLSSDDEDENYDAELRDDETAPTGAPAGRKPLKKKSCGIVLHTCYDLDELMISL